MDFHRRQNHGNKIIHKNLNKFTTILIIIMILIILTSVKTHALIPFGYINEFSVLQNGVYQNTNVTLTGLMSTSANLFLLIYTEKPVPTTSIYEFNRNFGFTTNIIDLQNQTSGLLGVGTVYSWYNNKSNKYYLEKDLGYTTIYEFYQNGIYSGNYYTLSSNTLRRGYFKNEADNLIMYDLTNNKYYSFSFNDNTHALTRNNTRGITDIFNSPLEFDVNFNPVANYIIREKENLGVIVPHVYTKWSFTTINNTRLWTEVADYNLTEAILTTYFNIPINGMENWTHNANCVPDILTYDYKGDQFLFTVKKSNLCKEGYKVNGRIYVLNGFKSINPPYQLVNGYVFDKYVCNDEGNKLCSDSTITNTGVYANSGIDAFGVHVTCNYPSALTSCSGGCDTFIQSTIDPAVTSVGYNQVITGYCNNVNNITCPITTTTCNVRDEFICISGNSYKKCTQDSNGCFNYVDSVCQIGNFCNQNNLTNPCSPLNLSGSYSKIDFLFGIQNKNTDSRAWNKLDNGNPNYPVYSTNPAQYQLSTNESIIGITYGYFPTANNQTYTSLICDYSENIDFDNNLNVTIVDYKINITNPQTTHKIKLNIEPNSLNSTSLMIIYGNYYFNSSILYVERNSTAKSICYYKSSPFNPISQLIGCDYGNLAYDDYVNSEIIVDFNSLVGVFDVEITTTRISNNNIIYSKPFNYSIQSYNSINLIETDGNDIWKLTKVSLIHHTDYSGYMNGVVNDYSAYSCVFTSGCHLTRLYASYLNFPAYHDYRDIYLCINGFSGNGVIGGGYASIIFPQNLSTADKLLIVSLTLIIVSSIILILGAVAGVFNIFVYLTLMIDVILVAFFTLIGYIPYWIPIVIIIIAAAILGMFIRKITVGNREQ